MKYQTVIWMLSTFVLTACSSTKRPSTIVMKVSDTEAYFDRGEETFDTGDEVIIFRKKCETRWRGSRGNSPRRVCKNIELGKGHITRTINDHYYASEFPPDVMFQEGDEIGRADKKSK